MAALCAEVRDPKFAETVRERLRQRLISRGKNLSPVERSLSSFDIAQLSKTSETPGLTLMLNASLLAFEEEGARQAFDKAQLAINEAHEVAHFIEATATSDEGAMGAALSALSELDGIAFERATLNNLLLLAQRPGDKAEFVEPMARLENRTSQWILKGIEVSGQSEWLRSAAITDQLRLKVLLHLVDVESQTAAETQQVLRRVIKATRVLLERLTMGPDSSVHRVLCAALARSFDAAVREGALQASDLVLATSTAVNESFSIATIAEASTLPDVAAPLRALAEFMDPGLFDSANELSDVGISNASQGAQAKTEHSAESLRLLERLMSLSQGIVGGGGYHPESLRRGLFRMARALELLAVASGIQGLVVSRDAMPAVLEELQSSAFDLAQMTQSARRRVLGESVKDEALEPPSHDLFSFCERAVTTDTPMELDALSQVIEALIEPLPEAIQRALDHILFVLRELPLSSRPTSLTMPLANRKAPLPNWLLPRRTIGSFHVVRPLGAGGVSSVFYARRIEERNRPGAEAFALKVPEYDPATARSMSEDEFYAMFRDEAGALLSLPEHENLARFVTFDLSARPKPILVMELISGTSLDRITRTRALNMKKVATYLDGVLAGLEAMHAVGVGHLDVKASNIILRGGKVPVLVDFGLSGRKVRPGCGTVEYTAPEVLGVFPEGTVADATKADIYAIGCLAFELLTGRLLFDGPDEMAVVSKHVAHDGWVDGLRQLAEQEESVALSSLLASCIRHDGRNRPTAAYLREQLSRVLLPLQEKKWPYAPSRA